MFVDNALYFTAPPVEPNISDVYSHNPTQLTVTWIPASSGSPATSFNVSISVEGISFHTVSVDGSERSYTFTGLTGDTNYLISVVAINCAVSHTPASQSKVGRTGVYKHACV